MKHEWKKQEQNLYGVKNTPQIITVPRQNYITLSGTGNPNEEAFSERVGVLYSLAYPLKMKYKAYCRTAGSEAVTLPFHDYSVYPLEGVWTTLNPDDVTDKDSFCYTVMIRQPDFITMEQFEETREAVARKKPHPLLNEVSFIGYEDGLSVQLLHRGSFDDEPASFLKMDEWIREQGYTRSAHQHREIYLNDARKTQPHNRQTILRYRISG